jgi:diaminopimelate epimerase
MEAVYKFHGTGNDFILMNSINQDNLPRKDQVIFLCDRHEGIGADGMIILREAEGYDFEMVYFNADGSPAKMCGNGARCAAAFAQWLGICAKQTRFLAGDGPHTAFISSVSHDEWLVDVSINDVLIPSTSGTNIEINTGTDHLVILTQDPDAIDVLHEGRKIRHSAQYSRNGININWLNIGENQLRVRTYERGVEAETLSCGTGVTASAIVAALKTGKQEWEIRTNGGILHVSMELGEEKITGIRLKGPAKMIFKATNLSV